MATSSKDFPNNLPIALSSFIGRGREIVEIKRLLSTARLLTLVGPGGSGKTRLAIWVAAELGEEFTDGAWLVELASLSDPALVPQSVATAFGVREHPGQLLTESLAGYLSTRDLLIVLDNCEHLVAACAQLADTLLRSSLNLKILATSREALNISGEMIWAVPSLSIPESPVRHDVAGNAYALLRYEAIRLFCERATAVSPAFAITDQNGPAVAEICQRLDGMPLAIELASARVRALSVEQIAERLATHDRFRLLTTGGRTAPARHQTLEATLDWSYALLSETERILLQRLSVFAGGWTLEAAEAVGAGDGVDAGEVLDTLSRLVDKSLVVVDNSGRELRYRLLETIRQYTREKLVESGATERTRERHLGYFVEWAEKATPYLRGPEQLVWLDRFGAEHDNLRAGLEWSQATGSGAEPGRRLAEACALFWRVHGDLSEGRMRLSAALGLPGADERTAARARTLDWAANLAYLQSDYPATRALCEESLSIWRELGQSGKSGLARALSMLGEVATEEGDYTTAPALFEEALVLHRALEDKRGIGDALMQLGWAAMRVGDYDQVSARLEESLTRFREVNDSRSVAFALAGLGELAVRQKQYERAARLLQESLAQRQEQGDKWGIGASLGSLGWVALCQRDFKRMRQLMRDSLSVRLETGDRGGIAWCLEKLAEAWLVEA